jgi:hypothetical protein
MEAIIEVKKGESPYKIVRSPWLKDKEGPVLFKLLSKKCLDGKIEAAYVVERDSGRKTILGRTIVEEERFMDAANAFRSVVWKFFPDVNLEIEDVEPIDISSPKSTSQYSVVKNTKIGIFWLKIKKWLGF